MRGLSLACLCLCLVALAYGQSGEEPRGSSLGTWNGQVTCVDGAMLNGPSSQSPEGMTDEYGCVPSWSNLKNNIPMADELPMDR